VFEVVLVGFLPTDNGSSCDCHPFGCGNILVLERVLHGVGMQIRLRMVDGHNLTGCQVKSDGLDGCCVCFAAKQYAIGVVGERLDGVIVQIKEVVMPDDENTRPCSFPSQSRLHHCPSIELLIELLYHPDLECLNP